MTQPINIAATAEGTAGYASRFPAAEGYFRQLGNTGLTVSAYGLGCYRVDPRVVDHHQAIQQALRSGVNLVDTSSNYAIGGSEHLLGLVLGPMLRAGELRREELVLVTKGGYAQGPNLELLRQADEQQKPYPDVVRYADHCWHCIHPRYLEQQLQGSLSRLGQLQVDVYLLHNPEYFLELAAREATAPLAARRDEYYRRIGQAFAWLEQQVDAGRIGSYGVSSNTLPGSPDAPDFTSLERLLELARELRADHHFCTIQLPANLLETGAQDCRNQRDGSMTVLELARETNLGVLINRPLNAFSGEGLVRLADHQDGQPMPAAAEFRATLEEDVPEIARCQTLSQQALLALSSLPGVSSVLVGMRTPAYVDDVTALKQQPLLPRAGRLFSDEA